MFIFKSSNNKSIQQESTWSSHQKK